MINTSEGPSSHSSNDRPYKQLLTAGVVGLALYVQSLIADGSIVLLTPERRIVLVLLALLLLTAIHSSLEAEPRVQAGNRPVYTRWQAGVMPFVLITPLLVTFWLAAGAMGGDLFGVTAYALAASALMLLAIINLIYVVVKSARSVPEPLTYGTKKFLMEAVLYGVYSFLLAVSLVGLILIAPDVLDDLVTVGSVSVYVYMILWVIRFVWLFFTGLIRQAAVESGLREGPGR